MSTPHIQSNVTSSRTVDAIYKQICDLADSLAHSLSITASATKNAAPDDPAGIPLPLPPVKTSPVEAKKKIAWHTANTLRKNFLRSPGNSPIGPGIQVGIKKLDALPVSKSMDAILKTVAENKVIIINAETGSGKSVMVPQYMAARQKAIKSYRCVAVTENRRIAAEALATYVSHLNANDPDELGEGVGLKHRDADYYHGGTNLLYATDGSLFVQIAKSKLLSQFGVIIVDETHERSVMTDLLLGELHRILIARSKDRFRVIIMSATLDIERFQEFFAPVLGGQIPPVVTIEGTLFSVTVNHWKHPLGSSTTHYCEEFDEDELELEDLAIEATIDVFERCFLKVRQIVTETATGDILVFVTGEAEIRKVTQRLQALQLPLLIVPLHSQLDTISQQDALRPSYQRKVIVSTNIAEASLTIDNIRHVVDSGLAKILRYNFDDDLNCLEEEFISKANAKQRAGRAGRTADGFVHRLYTEAQYLAMNDHPTPDIARIDPTDAIFQIIGNGTLEKFAWITKPDDRYIERSLSKLLAMGLIEKPGRTWRYTDKGKAVSEYHVGPMFGTAIWKAFELGCHREAAKIVAVLMDQTPLFDKLPKDCIDRVKQARGKYCKAGAGDYWTILNIIEKFDSLTHHHQQLMFCQALCISPAVLKRAQNAFNRIINRFKVFPSNDINREKCVPKGSDDMPNLINLAFAHGFFTQVLVREKRIGAAKIAVRTAKSKRAVCLLAVTTPPSRFELSIYNSALSIKSEVWISVCAPIRISTLKSISGHWYTEDDYKFMARRVMSKKR